MPTVLRIDGYRSCFYSNEGKTIHIHVMRGGAEANFWVTPERASPARRASTPALCGSWQPW